MNSALPQPFDVKLMNLTASVLFTVAAVGLLVAALWWLVRNPAFAIGAITVHGDVTHSNAVTLRANVAPRLAGNFFTISLPATREAFEAVPWVRQAVLQRVWPNRLRVLLEEHRAAALWEGGVNASDKLVNSFGEVFEANLGDVEDEALPTLRGPETAAVQMLAMLGRLQPVLAPMEARIDALELSGRGSWRVELDSGAEIELGRGNDDEVVARTERFVGTLTQVTSRFQRPLQYADLRHNEGYAVRLKGISTTVDPSGKPARK